MKTFNFPPTFYSDPEFLINELKSRLKISNENGRRNAFNALLNNIDEQLQLLNRHFPNTKQKTDLLRQYQEELVSRRLSLDHEVFAPITMLSDYLPYPTDTGSNYAITKIPEADRKLFIQLYQICYFYHCIYHNTTNHYEIISIGYTNTLYQLFVVQQNSKLATIDRILSRLNALLRSHFAHSNDPLHDYLVTLQPLHTLPIHIKQWGDLLTSLDVKKFSMRHYWGDSVKISEMLHKEKKPCTVTTIGDVKSRIIYVRAHENMELAKLCSRYDVSEKLFERCLTFLKDYPEKQRDNLPSFLVNGNDTDLSATRKYYFIKLPPNAYEGLILGKITDCCQSLDGHAKDCVKSGYLHENNGFYIFLKARHNRASASTIYIDTPRGPSINHDDFKIVGQSYAWISEEGQLVLDSFEAIKSVPEEVTKTMLIRFAEQVVADSENTIFRVTLGTGGKTPKFAESFKTIPELHPRDGVRYSDSLEQYELARRKNAQNTPNVHRAMAKMAVEANNGYQYLKLWPEELYHNEEIAYHIAKKLNIDPSCLRPGINYRDVILNAKINDEAYMLEHVAEDDFELYMASDRLKDNADFIITAGFTHESAINYASERLKSDPLFCLTYALLTIKEQSLWYTGANYLGTQSQEIILAFLFYLAQRYPYAKTKFSNQFSNNYDLLFKAVEKDENALKMASLELRDNFDLVLHAVKYHGHALSYASVRLRANLQIVIAAIKNNTRAHRYAVPELKTHPELINGLLEAGILDKEVIPKSIREELLNNRYQVIQLSKRFPQIIAELASSSQLFHHITIQINTAMYGWYSFCSKSFREDMRYALYAASRGKISLESYQKDVPLSIKSDFLFTLICLLKIGGKIYPYIPKELQCDPVILRIALSQYPNTFKDAPPETQDDFESAEFVFVKNGLLMKYASDRVKAEEKLALIAIKKNEEAFSHIASSLSTNKEFLKKAVQTNYKIMRFLKKELQNNFELITIALTSGYPISNLDFDLRLEIARIAHCNELTVEIILDNLAQALCEIAYKTSLSRLRNLSLFTISPPEEYQAIASDEKRILLFPEQQWFNIREYGRALLKIERVFPENLQCTQSNFLDAMAKKRLALLIDPATKQLIGYSIVEVQEQYNNYYLSSIAISPDYQRQGHARFMLQHLINHYLQNTVMSLTLHVDEENIAAITLYKQLGFTLLGTNYEHYGKGTKALRLSITDSELTRETTKVSMEYEGLSLI